MAKFKIGDRIIDDDSQTGTVTDIDKHYLITTYLVKYTHGRRYSYWMDEDYLTVLD